MKDNVIAFPNSKALASGRNRKKALGVIIPRIKELMSEGRTEIDGMQLMFMPHPNGGPSIYYRISEGGHILMTGFLNDRGKALIIEGQTVIVAHKYIADVGIMSWKRGDWEVRLFG